MPWGLATRKKEGRKKERLFSWQGRALGSMEDADPNLASPEGIVAIGGGDLSLENLQAAYQKGIFPWPHNGYPMLWFSPEPRAVLELDAVHIPKSLAKEQRKERFTFTIDTAFEQVVAACRATPRPEQDGTWITEIVLSAYGELHRAGRAHSVEAWNADGELVGGLYGVDTGGVFTGESMFYWQPYSSKLCLLYLFDHLRARGASFIDIQVMTPHFQQLGAVDISRPEFLRMLAAEQERNLPLFDPLS